MNVSDQPQPANPALDLVVEALRKAWCHGRGVPSLDAKDDLYTDTRESEARALLAKLAGEPVAWLYEHQKFGRNVQLTNHGDVTETGWTKTPLYLAQTNDAPKVCRLCNGTKVWHGAQCKPSKKHPTGYMSIDCPECVDPRGYR